MRQINHENWPRQEHFSVFKNWDFPHFNICYFDDQSRFPLLLGNGAPFAKVTTPNYYGMDTLIIASTKFRSRISR